MSLATDLRNLPWQIWIENGQVPKELTALVSVIRELSKSETYRILRLSMMISKHITDLYGYLNKIVRDHLQHHYNRDFLGLQKTILNLVEELTSANHVDWVKISKEPATRLLELVEVIEECVHNAFVHYSHRIICGWEALRNAHKDEEFVDTCMMELTFQCFDTEKLVKGSLYDNQTHKHAMLRSFIDRSIMTIDKLEENNITDEEYLNTTMRDNKDTISISWMKRQTTWFGNTYKKLPKITYTWFKHIMQHFLVAQSAWYGELFYNLNRKAAAFNHVPFDLYDRVIQLENIPDKTASNKDVLSIIQSVIRATEKSKRKAVKTNSVHDHQLAAEVVASILAGKEPDLKKVDEIIQSRTGFASLAKLKVVSAIVDTLADTELLHAAEVITKGKSPKITIIEDYIDLDGVRHKGNPPNDSDEVIYIRKADEPGVFIAKDLKKMADASTMQVYNDFQPAVLTDKEKNDIDEDTRIIAANDRIEIEKRLRFIKRQFEIQVAIHNQFKKLILQEVLRETDALQNLALRPDRLESFPDSTRNWIIKASLDASGNLTAKRVAEMEQRAYEVLGCEIMEDRIIRFEVALKERTQNISLKKFFITLLLFVLLTGLGVIWMTGSWNSVVNFASEMIPKVSLSSQETPTMTIPSWENKTPLWENNTPPWGNSTGLTSSWKPPTPTFDFDTKKYQIGPLQLTWNRFSSGPWETFTTIVQEFFYPTDIPFDRPIEPVDEDSSISRIAYYMFSRSAELVRNAGKTISQTFTIPEWRQWHNLNNYTGTATNIHSKVVYLYFALFAARDVSVYGISSYLLFMGLYHFVDNAYDYMVGEDRRLVDGALVQSYNFIRSNAKLFGILVSTIVLTYPVIYTTQFLVSSFMVGTLLSMGTALPPLMTTLIMLLTNKTASVGVARLEPAKVTEQEKAKEVAQNLITQVRELIKLAQSGNINDSTVAMLKDITLNEETQRKQIRAELITYLPSDYPINLSEDERSQILRLLYNNEEDEMSLDDILTLENIPVEEKEDATEFVAKGKEEATTDIDELWDAISDDE